MALSPGSKFPEWPGWTLSSVTACAIYLCFASLFGKWPVRRGVSREDHRASVTKGTEHAGQSMSGSPGSIQSGPRGKVKTRDVFIMNSPASPSQDEAAEAKPEPLQPRYDQSPAYRHAAEPSPGITEHRVGVFNPLGLSARRVRMYLVRMDPYPRNVLEPRYQPVIPYTVPLQSGGDPSVGHTIGSRQEELWIIGYTATGSDGNMNAGEFAVPDQRWRGLPWRFDPDERWRLFYQIACDGRPDVEFTIVVTAADGQLRCDLEG